MPELPEVETVARDLRPALVGRTLLGVQCGKLKLRRPWQPAAELPGSRVLAVRRRGKYLLLDLHSGPCLLVHLGMTGQLTVGPANVEPAPHTHFRFPLDVGGELRYVDIRRFGFVEWHATPAGAEASLQLGPEPWDIAPEQFRAAVRSSARCLKAILLDQTVVAGVGNIYADEASFRAGLHPERRGTSITNRDCDKLLVSIRDVLETAIAGRGSTIRNYVGGSGLMGTYQGEFLAYGRTGEPCVRCAALIECVRLAGRSSHYCPKCQRPKPEK
jgi:formamidopyrimidine-DNA glycosylase